jgi:hypothetical protein
MTAMFDRNLVTQIGLDSGALTMLGAVVHSFREPGQYRGTVRSGDLPEAVFYISVDKSCAVAHATIDLAKLVPATDATPCRPPPGDLRFLVHPKGFVLFNVSGGPGGYSVNVRRATEDPEVKAYDSRRLEPGDVFSGVLFRPGTYSIRNLLSQATAEASVAYPVVGDTAYRPPAAAVAQCAETIEPHRIELQPMQGLNFEIKVPARIRIELTAPDDGPGSREPGTDG